MKRILVSSIALTLMCGVAQAALWNSAWSGANYASISDATGDQATTARDILSLECIFGSDTSGNGYYFRMTIGSDPTGGGYSQSYMLNFNTDNLGTGNNHTTSTYVANGLSGIDMIVDAHYFQNALISNHHHDYSLGTPDTRFTSGTTFVSNGDKYQAVGYGAGGYELEWFVPAALLPVGATVYGSTMNVASSIGDPDAFTYDITDGFAVVPEPTSMALLALGMVALGLRRKVRK